MDWFILFNHSNNNQQFMKIESVKINELKTNPNNPRIIKDAKFVKLVKSIKEFPKMMELRPLIIDENNMILGGNMRFKALKQLEYTNIPKEWIKRANELTKDEIKRFIIADNIGFGEHDWDILANEWNSEDLVEWGLDVWNPEDFDNDSDDFDSIQGEDSGTTIALTSIKFKNYIIYVTKEEEELFQNAIDRHLADFGILTGVINQILKV